MSQRGNTGGEEPAHEEGLPPRQRPRLGSPTSDGHTATEQDEEQVGLLMLIVAMSLCYQGHMFGFAAYSARTAILEAYHDKLDDVHWTNVRSMIQNKKPTVLLVHASIEAKIKELLKELRTGVAPEVIRLPKAVFDHTSAVQRVAQLKLPELQDSRLSDTHRHLYFSFLQGDDTLMARALGALVHHIERTRFGVELDPTDTPVPIVTLQLMAQPDCMLIDADSLTCVPQSLGVFNREPHPSSFKAGGFKEGLSLYGILNSTKTAAGARCLRRWLQQPSTSADEIERRQEVVGYMANAANTELLQHMRRELARVRPVQPILRRLRMQYPKLQDWTTLRTTCLHAMNLKGLCQKHRRVRKLDEVGQSILMFRAAFGMVVFESLADGIGDIAEAIAAIVSHNEEEEKFDEEASKEQDRFIVRPLISPELDEKKRQFNNLPDFLTAIAQEEMHNMPPGIAEYSVVYLPQLGFLISATLDAERQGDPTLDGLEFMFLSDGRHFFKNPRMRHLDNVVGDTQCDITDMENSLMVRLQERILDYTAQLLRVHDAVAELDCLLSMSLAAVEFSWVQPGVRHGKGISIHAGRHPLQELCVSPFIPNHTRLAIDDEPHAMLLTGPNGSGKSIYLKQIGLIVVLAQVGSFVPAESAVIGIVDRLFTRIQTRESVSLDMSTFLIDTNQVATALKYASPYSLVLIDEYGKGTTKEDGVALAVSTIKHLMERPALDPPMLVFTTHFLDIPKQQLVAESAHLRYFRMASLDQAQHQDDDDTADIVLLYQVQPGVSGSSHALRVAAQAELPIDVIERAQQVSEAMHRNLPIAPLQSMAAKQDLAACQRVCEAFLALDLKSATLQADLKRICAASRAV
ncbi:hypothetical protein PTSG_11634 [Salpingoeca rosetta]|uniref:DNA mismatch repair proteins mutS family domain-containing protein n=1 Tax=Salpingoeca rosetta (strain ATCC 50818 / BSB-021) TaxID=946362 RepID=F2TXA9_SALR5|nr:uncharacterized protein PTSG_11634 [Salpingoeca rosetta]EGD76018.1 hypothetical protein PTSG_11634 [Salpingoeca rosetta]|eukprot:XP_004998193.1 hypothetical protein PTSG_11634 [Salpingoeca rosetta]